MKVEASDSREQEVGSRILSQPPDSLLHESTADTSSSYAGEDSRGLDGADSAGYPTGAVDVGPVLNERDGHENGRADVDGAYRRQPDSSLEQQLVRLLVSDWSTEAAHLEHRVHMVSRIGQLEFVEGQGLRWVCGR
ncbi:hypothetical protein RWH45_06555 [Microbacterium sp. KSW4-17]|uniref:Uncharacterized protein n=1 Tax=Microbacterium galbum TaxID=3075994 RepID=A0ABU3T6D9_9MICO|nr:hypothetical protein [Microbacterium sp. KSW4-17]MDU0366870.1 hypothetical protein [Microbacterium sp. KSW4-17]